MSVYVSGQDAADLNYVNAGTDRRIGGPIGKIAGRIQSAYSFKSPTPPTRTLEERNGVYVEIATAPNGKPHISVAFKYGRRWWFTIRAGWRYDANWGDEGTLGFNPQPEIRGGYIFDLVPKLRAQQSFIDGVE